MPAVANEGDEQIEGLGCQRDRFSPAQQQALSGRQNKVAKLENPIFCGAHCTILGDLQEKFKAYPETSCRPRSIIWLPGVLHRTSPSPRGRDYLLYTSDAADDLLCVDLGGRRIIK